MTGDATCDLAEYEHDEGSSWSMVRAPESMRITVAGARGMNEDLREEREGKHGDKHAAKTDTAVDVLSFMQEPPRVGTSSRDEDRWPSDGGQDGEMHGRSMNGEAPHHEMDKLFVFPG